MATVRRATLGDADAIGRVHVRSWTAAFEHILPEEALAGQDAEKRAEMWRDRIRTPIPNQELLVAVDAGAVVGFALVGTADSGRAAEIGQLYSINLTPEAWGRGTGEALLLRAQQELASRGMTSAILWIAEDNVRARRFYERHGWESTDDRRTETMLDTPVKELAYRRDLP